MIAEEYIADRGKPLMFSDESSRSFGEIKIGFYRVFGATSSWEINYCCVPITNSSFVCNRKRTETDGGGVDCDGITNTCRA